MKIGLTKHYDLIPEDHRCRCGNTKLEANFSFKKGRGGKLYVQQSCNECRYTKVAVDGRRGKKKLVHKANLPKPPVLYDKRGRYVRKPRPKPKPRVIERTVRQRIKEYFDENYN